MGVQGSSPQLSVLLSSDIRLLCCTASEDIHQGNCPTSLTVWLFVSCFRVPRYSKTSMNPIQDSCSFVHLHFHNSQPDMVLVTRLLHQITTALEILVITILGRAAVCKDNVPNRALAATTLGVNDHLQPVGSFHSECQTALMVTVGLNENLHGIDIGKGGIGRDNRRWIDCIRKQPTGRNGRRELGHDRHDLLDVPPLEAEPVAVSRLAVPVGWDLDCLDVRTQDVVEVADFLAELRLGVGRPSPSLEGDPELLRLEDVLDAVVVEQFAGRVELSGRVTSNGKLEDHLAQLDGEQPEWEGVGHAAVILIGCLSGRVIGGMLLEHSSLDTGDIVDLSGAAGNLPLEESKGSHFAALELTDLLKDIFQGQGLFGQWKLPEDGVQCLRALGQGKRHEGFEVGEAKVKWLCVGGGIIIDFHAIIVWSLDDTYA